MMGTLPCKVEALPWRIIGSALVLVCEREVERKARGQAVDHRLDLVEFVRRSLLHLSSGLVVSLQFGGESNAAGERNDFSNRKWRYSTDERKESKSFTSQSTAGPPEPW